MEIAEIVNSNLPLDWVTLPQFGKLIGLPSSRIYQAKEKWPEGKVWQKIDGKLYFSLRGWNEWLNQQSIQRASEYEAAASKLISRSMGRVNTLPFRSRQRQKASKRRENYELT